MAHASFWSYFSQATVMVQLVMVLLMILSIISWTYIVQHGKFIADLKRRIAKFEANFWSGQEITQLYHYYKQQPPSDSGLEHVFLTGFKAFLQHQSHGTAHSAKQAMQMAYLQDSERLEMRLNMLATIGSVAPYIGLLGTVWGIMHAFHSLGTMKQVTMAMVAPGISEALAATALGLLTAIPAVMAYNRFTDSIAMIEQKYKAFIDLLACLLTPSHQPITDESS